MIIADGSDPRRRALIVASGAALLAAACGAIATIVYARAGLTLSHYDAKAHLVVARRIADSLTPGWEQIGAVWLPLPHLLNVVPVQLDVNYRAGASAIAVSMLSSAVAAGALAWLVTRATGSASAAFAAAALFAFDPNVLYLQATPMTEPLLLGLLALAIALEHEWIAGGAGVRCGSLAFAAACLTRYEAWPVTVMAAGLGALALWRHGAAAGAAIRRAAGLLLWPTMAIAAFLVLSRATVGEWFVAGGFFVPDNIATGRPLRAAAAVWWGYRQLVGTTTAVAAAGAMVALLALAGRARGRAAAIVAVALLGSATLPWYAFYQGHPFRIRYMVPLIPAGALATGVAIGFLPKGRTVAAVLATALALTDGLPFDRSAVMVQEAQLDRANSAGRQAVTRCLARDYRGEKILASMASLAHFMHETSAAGIHLVDYVHEGNGDLWTAAVAMPRRHVGWVVTEEVAEGGDRLAARAREDPQFLEGFARACEGGGVALYRRRSQ